MVQQAGSCRSPLPPALLQPLTSCNLCGSTVPLAEKGGFFSISLTSTIQTMQSFTGPLPQVPKFAFLSPSFHRTTPAKLGHVHPECHSPHPCTHSHQGSQGPPCPLHSCRRKGWIKKMWWHCTGTGAKSPPDKPHIAVWKCKTTFAGLGFCPK